MFSNHAQLITLVQRNVLSSYDAKSKTVGVAAGIVANNQTNDIAC